MQKTEARAGQLVRWNAKNGVRYVQTSAIGVAQELERRIGQVYAIIVVDAATKAGEALFAHVEDAFCRGALEAARRCSADATAEMLFESTVAQVNHAVARALGERGLGIEPEYVSAALVAVHGHDIVAAVWGRPSILLYHQTSQGLRAYDLVDDDGSTATRRCFGSIISGSLGDHDRLLLATQDVRDILGDDGAASAMAAADPAMATKLLRDALAPIEEDLTIALLALDVAPVRYVEDLPAGRPVTTQSSLADLRRMESRTEEILSPSPLSAIQKTVAQAASAVRGNGHRAAASSAAPDAATAPAAPRARREISVSGAMVGAVKAMFVGAWKLLKAFAAIQWRTAPRDAAAWSDATMHRLVERYNALSGLRKRILFGILLSLLALNSSVLVGDWKAGLEDYASAAERRVTAITQKVDSAEASLIYRDEARARALLDEAAAATAALPDRTARDRQIKIAVEARIASARDSMRHAVTLKAPEVIATVALTSGETPTLAKLTTAGGALWGVSSKGELFRISPADGAAQKSADLAAAPKVVVPITSGVLAAAGSGSATIVPASGTGSAKTARLDAPGANIADADTWNGRLYVLDPSHNRIIRLEPDAQGFGAGQFYLKDATDVSKAVSLAIDGGVWVLSSDGKISHLVKGARETFTAAAADPLITDARRIRTTPESESLYVLDGSPARIIRFDKKSGALMAQYVSPALEGATDFTVDESSKSFLVTVGNQVLKFGLPE